MGPLKMYFLLKIGKFHCYVSLPEGKITLYFWTFCWSNLKLSMVGEVVIFLDFDLLMFKDIIRSVESDALRVIDSPKRTCLHSWPCSLCHSANGLTLNFLGIIHHLVGKIKLYIFFVSRYRLGFTTVFAVGISGWERRRIPPHLVWSVAQRGSWYIPAAFETARAAQIVCGST